MPESYIDCTTINNLKSWATSDGCLDASDLKVSHFL